MTIILSAMAGSTLADPVGVGQPTPHKFHECTNCHSEDPDLCITKNCREGTVCVGREGAFDDGQLWVSAHCINDPA